MTEDGGITIFDNQGDDVDLKDDEKEVSRVIKIYLDEKNKKVLNFEEYSLDDIFTYSRGSAQELSKGRYAIGLGVTKDKAGYFMEKDFNTGRILFSIGENKSGGTYRVYKYKK